MFFPFVAGSLLACWLLSLSHAVSRPPSHFHSSALSDVIRRVTDCRLVLPSALGTPISAMSLSRSPSPVPGGGWASPGLTNNLSPSGRSSPTKAYAGSNGTPVMWERQKSMGGPAYQSFATQNQGFLSRHMRRISSSLPRFRHAHNAHDAEKEKNGQGRWSGLNMLRLGRIRGIPGRMNRRTKMLLAFFLLFLLGYILFYSTREFMPQPLGLSASDLTYQKLWCTTTEEHHGLAGVKSLLSFWQPTLAVVSWSGRAPESGRSRETQSATRKNTLPSGDTISRLST